jgi:predicted dehydrogenase
MGSLAALGGYLAIRSNTRGQPGPNDKLNIGVIGVANRGGEDLKGVSSQNIVALCDVDDRFLGAVAPKYPGAKTYNDFRRMLDQPGIDAVVVGTPDHIHAVAAVAAMQSGRHVYCEKPLARTISEVNAIMKAAVANRRVTQIGTQIHALKNYRRVVEHIKSGSIGDVREVHVWVSSTYGGSDMPTDRPPVPQGLHYDLWLGPVKEVPYHPEWVPKKWRNWWAFGGGSLADFGCHYMDLPHWALDLRVPLSAEAEGPPVHRDSVPPWAIVRYQHPARGSLPPVALTWYHGGKQPPLLTPEHAAKWKSGVLFVGQKGQLLADYNRHVLLPEDSFVGFEPPRPFIPNSIGHHEEWIEACKTGGKTTCGFDYSGPLTETALLGNVAYRVGRKLEWDSAAMKARNAPEAAQYIHHDYRSGWSI